MSYAKFGTNCMMQSIAYTSNTKFLSPTDPVYFQPFVRVNIPPEGKKVKKVNNNEEKFEQQIKSNGCKSCGAS